LKAPYFFGALLFSFFLALLPNALGMSLDQLGQPNGFVNDYAGVLSYGEERLLEEKVAAIERNSTVEIAIVLVNSTDGMPINDYANKLGNQWGVGKKGAYNGVMLVAAINDREWFVSTAKGIEGTLPDLLVNRVGKETLVPNFKQGNYFKGLDEFLTDVGGYAANDSEIVAAYGNASDYGEPEAWVYLTLFLPIIIIIIIVIITLLVIKGKRGGNDRMGGSNWRSSSHSSGRSFSGGGGFSGGGSGGRW